ncbi:MAG TPA: hypothetical protein VF135_11285, partial [Terriglobales bacterium]
TVAEADTYNSAHLFGEAWAPLAPDVKVRALYTATQLLNTNVKLAVVTDGTVAIPQSLKNATAEYARILATDSGADPAEAGGGPTPKRLDVGPIRLDFGEAPVSDLPAPYVTIPPHVLAMIAHLIQELVVPRTTTMMPLKAV